MRTTSIKTRIETFQAAPNSAALYPLRTTSIKTRIETHLRYSGLATVPRFENHFHQNKD
ncbi:Uncharacterized protein dnm_098370 [Desulfonema magnum]|uniref:Uncharacterized protein n=1 Tax=Desulfonema magnum TaxID=45655 RepID=A0A975GW25_9BACT|nr:Uncharacterized protein dnm_098370 [Desulfonema magnum]